MPKTTKTKEKKVREEEHFCSYCGKRMDRTILPAELIEITYCGWGDCFTRPLGHPYNDKTGERQFGYVWKCPDYTNKKWYQPFSPHDSFEGEQIISLPKKITKKKS